MVLDSTLLNTQYYKVRIKCKVELSKKEPLGRPRLRSPTLLYVYISLGETGRHMYGEELQPPVSRQPLKHGGSSVMVWWVFADCKVRDLH